MSATIPVVSKLREFGRETTRVIAATVREAVDDELRQLGYRRRDDGRAR